MKTIIMLFSLWLGMSFLQGLQAQTAEVVAGIGETTEPCEAVDDTGRGIGGSGDADDDVTGPGDTTGR